MPEPLTPERLAELRRHWLGDVRHECKNTPNGCGNLGRNCDYAEVQALCDTIDAQATVIERFKNEWIPSPDEQWAGMWVEADDLHRPLPVEDRDREPMTDAEQLVVYGRLVSGQEGNDGG